jgi:hypothetical protein
MSKKFVNTIPSLVFILAFLLSACGPSATPAPTADINAIYTQAAATIAANMTQTALAVPSATLVPPTATATVTATFAPLPTQAQAATPTVIFAPMSPVPAGPTAVPVNTATANGCYNSALVADVTVPSGTKFQVGDTFVKTWLVKNTGTCDWNPDFKITFVGGDAFGTDTTKIRQKIGVGATVEISIGMTAPNASGVSESYWQMFTDDGKGFGQVFGVSIVLPGGVAATSTSVSTANPNATATSTSGGCYQSTLMSESVVSGTTVKQGEGFTQTWVIKNTGSCAWNGNFKLTFVGGEMFGFDTTKIRQDVEPGNSLTISLDMVAPGSSGSFSTSWQLAADDGTLFGQTFTFKITVK